MAPFFGNSVACRIAEAHEIKHSTLVLGDWRAAQRIEFYIGRNGEGNGNGNGGSYDNGQQQQRRHQRASSTGGSSTSSLNEASAEASNGERSVVTGRGGFKIWVVNTHLDHEHPDNRQRQVLGSRTEARDCFRVRLACIGW